MSNAVKKGASKRIYVVENKEGAVALVNAVSGAAALSYVVRGEYAAKVATQTDLVELVSTGMEVQETGEKEGE